MLAIALTADLAGVTDLQPTDTEENPYFYTFKVQCTSCRETHPTWVTVNRQETNELSGSRGQANFVWKCKNCKRESSAAIKAAPALYAQQSPAKAKNIVELDCRGLEFVEFKADGDFEATGLESGTKFAAIDLSDGEWFDYDEKAGEETHPPKIKSNAEIVGTTATDPIEKISTSKAQNEKKEEQERLWEDISAEKGTTAAKTDSATGSETQTRKKKKRAGFGAVFERNLCGMLRWVRREESSEVTEPEKESEEPEVEGAMAICTEPRKSNDNRPALKVGDRLQRVHEERPEYAEFSAEYLAYIRRGGFR